METESKPRFHCFVIMPFSDTVHTANGAQVNIRTTEWEHIYKEWIRKAVESYPDADISCIRSAAVPGNFVKGIIQEIEGSELVVADLTGSRPNVYYELGIRHALRTGTVIITQDFGALPNDLRSYYCFEYRYTSAAHEYGEAFERFTASMHEKIRSVITNNFPGDSPVSDFLGYERYSKAREFEQEKDRLIGLLEVFKDIAVKIHTNCENLIKKLETAETFPHDQYVYLMDLELLNELYCRLLLDFSSQDFKIEQLSTARKWVELLRELAIGLKALSSVRVIKGTAEERVKASIGNLPSMLVRKGFPQQIEEMIKKVRSAKPPSVAVRNSV